MEKAEINKYVGKRAEEIEKETPLDEATIRLIEGILRLSVLQNEMMRANTKKRADEVLSRYLGTRQVIRLIVAKFREEGVDGK